MFYYSFFILTVRKTPSFRLSALSTNSNGDKKTSASAPNACILPRFIFYHTLSYSIKHYAQKEHKITDDYGDLIIIPNHQFKSLSSTDRINYIKELKINNPWLNNVISIVLQQSIINLNNAYNNFFIIYNYNEDNAKKVIQNVLTYHKNKVNHLPEKVNKPGKLKLNNKLLFSKINKTQA